MAKKTALVVAPGRGTYNKSDLGYLQRFHHARADLLHDFDTIRIAQGQEPITSMDGAEQYSAARLTRGDNASGLIYACAYTDFISINKNEIDVVAITGNSMGWYIALACSGVLTPQNGFLVVNTMGKLMHEASIGGQTIYPIVDENWREIEGKREELVDLIDLIPNLYLSINLGGMIVFGGDEKALKEAERQLTPVGGRFPMRLMNHAAFHTPLQYPISQRAQASLSYSLFMQPKLPLIDGRGSIWFQGASDLNALWNYTFEEQIINSYDFSSAITTGIHEFAPDIIIVLGPGATLGGAVAQILIANKWRGISGKDDFMKCQANNPLVPSFGIEEQRALVVGK